MKLVTGGAGFIGSHLVDAFVSRGEDVVVLDDLSTGRKEFLDGALRSKRVRLVRGDCQKDADLRKALRDVDEVWHLAADPDVREGIRDPWSNFRDGAVLTFRVLDAMRRSDAKAFVYASSSTVYGEASVLPTPETYGPLVPVSPYGASKLAGEAVASAFVGTFGFRAWIFRFGNVVGPRLTHGAVHDFHKKLRRDPKRLQILGDGRQTKAYLSEEDCVGGMLWGQRQARQPCNILNLASGTTTNVARIAQIVAEEMGLRGVEFTFTGGSRGWKGDVARMDLDIGRMRSLGWSPKHSSEEAVRRAAGSLATEEKASAQARATRRRP